MTSRASRPACCRPILLFTFTLGADVLQLSPALPHLVFGVICLILAVVAMRCWSSAIIPAAFVFGAAFATLVADYHLSKRLPSNLSGWMLRSSAMAIIIMPAAFQASKSIFLSGQYRHPKRHYLSSTVVAKPESVGSGMMSTSNTYGQNPNWRIPIMTVPVFCKLQQAITVPFWPEISEAKSKHGLLKNTAPL